MSRFRLQEEQRPLDCQFRCKAVKSISWFVNYIVDGNRKKFFSVMQRNTTLSHYCRPNMIWKFKCLGVLFAN